MITHEQLVRGLAKVSHSSLMRQAADDPEKDPDKYGGLPHRYDYERASDVVRELERLGIFPRNGTSRAPHHAGPA